MIVFYSHSVAIGAASEPQTKSTKLATLTSNRHNFYLSSPPKLVFYIDHNSKGTTALDRAAGVAEENKIPTIALSGRQIGGMTKQKNPNSIFHTQ